MLSSPALDLLRRARERLTNQPTSTLWLAAFHEDHAPLPSAALDEIANLPAELLDLSGAEACDEVTRFLADTIPAPPPTVETPAPVDEEAFMVAAFCLGEAWEQMERARKLLGAKGEPKLPALQKELTAFAGELAKTLEERPLKEVA
jgi:hypothetical protein